MLWITLFSIAMGYLESSVVVYLREILYPAGFAFPLVPISPRLAVTEVFREAATLVMLLGAGMMAGRTRAEKFAFFIYSFAVWDIFYYVFLKLLLGWPSSLLTWDILFLLPVTWTGPVLAPLLSSLAMICLALVIVFFNGKEAEAKLSCPEWIVLISGATAQLLAFTWDYARFILHHSRFVDLWTFPGRQYLFGLSAQYLPVSFNWGLFLAGEISIILVIVHFFRRQRHVAR